MHFSSSCWLKRILVEVVDLRTFTAIGLPALPNCTKTGKVLVAHEANVTGG